MQTNFISSLFAARTSKLAAKPIESSPIELDTAMQKHVAGGDGPKGTWAANSAALGPKGTWGIIWVDV